MIKSDDYYKGRVSMIRELDSFINRQMKLNRIAKIARESKPERNIPEICTICGDTNALRKMKIHLSQKLLRGAKAKNKRN